MSYKHEVANLKYVIYAFNDHDNSMWSGGPEILAHIVFNYAYFGISMDIDLTHSYHHNTA